MRRIFDIKDMLASALGVIPDTVVLILAKLLGCPNWLALLICFVPSTLGERWLGMLAEKLIDVGKAFACVAVTLVLALSGFLFWKFGGENLLSSLPFYLVPCILISSLSTLVVSYRTRRAEERVTREFEKTGGEVLADEEIAQKIMDNLKGENREITGEYPKKDAAVCENGIFVGRRKDGLLVFKGIPYAQPPVGELRWRNPVRVAPSGKVFEAYYYGKAEPQPCRNYSDASRYDMSEDCLTLNIWKSGKARKNCPVTVWIGTLDWCTGGTASELKAGDAFVSENPEVIYVDMNFRIGLFGNMDFSDVPGGEAYPDAANLGLKDILESLRWIHRNIAAFGGDPSNVTLVGCSGGGTAAALLAIHKEARGLFRRAVSFGGSVVLTNDMDTFRTEVKTAKSILKAKTMDEFLQLPAENLAAAIDEMDFYDFGVPVKDGITVPLDYRQGVAETANSGIELLFCVPEGEAGLLSVVSGDKQKTDNQIGEIIRKEYNNSSEQQKQCLASYIARYYSSEPDSLVSSAKLMTEMYYHYPMLNLCQVYSRAGGTVRYLVWDIKSPVEVIGASSVVINVVLRNRKDYYEDCGVTGDPLVFQAVRKMLVDFAKTGDPSLKYGELKNVGEENFPVYNDEDGSVTILTEQGLKQDGGGLRQRIQQLEPLEQYLLF